MVELGLDKIADNLFALNRVIYDESDDIELTPLPTPNLIGNAGQSYTPTQDISLYAKWLKNIYVVIFDPNGGQVVGPESVTVNHGDPVGTIPGGLLSGYKLAGWFPQLYNNDNELRSDTPITSNRTYYAHWALSYVTITFLGNGGSLNYLD